MSSLEMITFLPTQEDMDRMPKKPKTVKLGENTFLWLASLSSLENVYPTPQDEIIVDDESYKVLHYIYKANSEKEITTYVLTIKKR